jgi:hypothetical protein
MEFRRCDRTHHGADVCRPDRAGVDGPPSRSGKLRLIHDRVRRWLADQDRRQASRNLDGCLPWRTRAQMARVPEHSRSWKRFPSLTTTPSANWIRWGCEVAASFAAPWRTGFVLAAWSARDRLLHKGELRRQESENPTREQALVAQARAGARLVFTRQPLRVEDLSRSASDGEGSCHGRHWPSSERRPGSAAAGGQ